MSAAAGPGAAGVAVLASPARALRRTFRLLAAAVGYEARKQSAFRVGFLVREVLRGVERAAIMIFVYLALFRANGGRPMGTYGFADMVEYLILAATLQKIVFHERGLDVSTQIFDGYITKYAVMPCRYFTLAAGRWIQFTAVQVPIAALFWLAGLLIVPGRWPVPASAAAVGRAAVLVLVGSWCFFVLFFALNCLAFWLDVVWSFLAMARMVTTFAMGELIPVSVMPGPLRATFAWIFPYWTLSAPIEILTGRLGAADFRTGLLVLGGNLVLLHVLAAVAWRRGLRRYAGSGM